MLPHRDSRRQFVASTTRWFFAIVVVTCIAHAAINAQSSRTIRVAVLDFGNTATGLRAANQVRNILAERANEATGIVLIDQNLAAAAASGNGYRGSLNLTTQEARDLGAAIGCDLFVIGEAQTLARSPSNGANYFESYASVFIVSARTGQLIHWERPNAKRDTADDAEKVLLGAFAGEDARHRLSNAIITAFDNEAAARAAAVENRAATIEVMSDDDTGKSDTRAPRPYRRVKPPYPEAAAQSEVDATVDVFVDVDARGEISRVEVARWAGYGLDEAVTGTIRQMHFFPAMRDGVPIAMRVLLRYNFRHTVPDQSTANPENKLKIIIKPRP